MGIQGVSTIPADTGVGTFQGLKFVETSYKNEGTKFSLVITFKYDEPGTFHPEVIQSVISPPIFIDSRRTARSLKNKKEYKTKFGFEEYNPSRLTQVLIKRVKDSEQEISNTPQGLINYFTAPNIRNKIKNPFFLGIRFNKVIKLYYNSIIISNKDNIMKTVMKRLNQTYIEDQVKSKKQRKTVEGIGQSTVLCVKVQGDQALVKEIISKLENSSVLQFYSGDVELPQFFVEASVSLLKSQYEEYYDQGQDVSETSEVQRQPSVKKEHLVLRPIPYRPPVFTSTIEPKHSNLHHEHPLPASYRQISTLPYRYKQIRLITTCNERQQKARQGLWKVELGSRPKNRAD